MKIALPCMGKEVAQHFGHCEQFCICEIEGEKLVSSEFIPNPGHKPGFLPNFLADKGVEILIAGGIGGGAIDIFNERNVKVVTGAAGDALAVVQEFLKGNVQSTGSVCSNHEHEGSCSH